MIWNSFHVKLNERLHLNERLNTPQLTLWLDSCMKKLFLSLALSPLWVGLSLAEPLPTLKINEASLLKTFNENAHNLLSIKAESEAAKLGAEQVKDNFNWRLEGTAAYTSADEVPFIIFQPVTSPYKRLEVGAVKTTPYGAQLGVSAFTEQYSTTSGITDATTSGLAFKASVDLYKDFFGRTSRAQLFGAESTQEKVKQMSELQKHALWQQVRKIYWSLVANNESLKISNQLLQTSEKQSIEAQKRFRNNIADKGEVARYQSQVAARKANIIYLKYQKEQYIQQLKEIIPEYADKKIELAGYNLESTLDNILSCTTKISQQQELPLDFTSYDEFLVAVEKEYAATKKVTDTYSSPDVKLNTEYRRFGRDYSYSDSVSGFGDDKQDRFEVGLTFTLPLDSKKSTTEDTKKIVEELRYKAEKTKTIGKMGAFHTQVIQSIALLRDVIANQRINSEKLQISLNETKKKYDQARISVQELIIDQDAYLQSNLDEIQTKLAVINTLLDYFGVFNSTPCEINTTL